MGSDLSARVNPSGETMTAANCPARGPVTINETCYWRFARTHGLIG